MRARTWGLVGRYENWCWSSLKSDMRAGTAAQVSKI